MTMNIDDIENFINNQDLDIRKRGNNPRFSDQKCTPDVLSLIAEMAIHQGKGIFSPRDVWDSPEFIKRVKKLFGKPSPTNEKACKEYDKFIGHSLELFAYAGILEKQKIGRSYSYAIVEKEILEYVSSKNWNAFLFLNAYFKKFLSDSGFISVIDNFFQLETSQSFYDMREQFIAFMQNNTKIGSRGSVVGGETEIRRIFPKIINVLAVQENKKGIVRGCLSGYKMTYSELMYNRENFRDVDKPKEVTRQENVISGKTISQNNYTLNKVKAQIKERHKQSEVNDKLKGAVDHIHHIFPKEEFPIIANYTENLIALTAGQHLTRAHPRGNTQKIDIQYQRVCLLAKKQTIENQLKKGERFYSKESFIYVINVGFRWIDTGKELKSHATFEEIDDAITRYYRYI